jgi:hypothetical protein
MSFSSDLKEELTRAVPTDKRAMSAEIASLLVFGTTEYLDSLEIVRLRFLSEHISTTKKLILLLKDAFKLEVDFFVRRHHQTAEYGIEITGRRTIKNLFAMLGIKNTGRYDGVEIAGKFKFRGTLESRAEKAAFLRGAFLVKGSMSDPLKSYHFEVNVADEAEALALKNIMKSFSPEANMTKRKGFFPVYLKDGSAISDLLIELGASKAMLDFENARIVRETRGNVNRRVNCEVSNIKKAASAGQRQLEAINLIIKEGRLEALPDTLKQMALLRIDNPEASLQELGELVNPPLGRSGVNHRLQRLMDYAAKIKS